MFDEPSTKSMPKVAYDETLLSWMTRGVRQGKFLNNHLLARALEDLVLPVQYWRPRGFEIQSPEATLPDMEFEPGENLLKLLSNTYELSKTAINQRFGSNGHWNTSIEYRTLYCRVCFDEALTTTGGVVWKRSWCRATAAYCCLHGVPLSQPLTRPEVIQRLDHVLLHHVRVKYDGYEEHVSRLCRNLTLRVQCWLQDVECNRWGGVHIFGSPYNLIYAILLSRRTVHARGGLATTSFGQKKISCHRSRLSFFQRLTQGICESDAVQRSGALLIVGWLFGRISTSEIEKAAIMEPRLGRLITMSPKTLGREAVVAVNNQEHYSMLELLSYFHNCDHPVFSDFFQGLCSYSFARKSRSYAHRDGNAAV
ncbi:hypothetical protein ACF8E6_03660 [Pseudomonas sp. xss_1]|uniref:hypothetical protein n=1 Tax=Pseudomonas sp. xss_1 TaxID=3367214 RepID=UPI00370CC80C